MDREKRKRSKKKINILKTLARLISCEDVPLVEFMYLVFTRMPVRITVRRLRSLLLYLCFIECYPLCVDSVSCVGLVDL